jgi:hypothetical protein
MVAPTLLELVTVTQVPEENWSVFVEQIERTTINMREFKEHLYRMIFLKFGLLIDKVVPNWS